MDRLLGMGRDVNSPPVLVHQAFKYLSIVTKVWCETCCSAPVSSIFSVCHICLTHTLTMYTVIGCDLRAVTIRLRTCLS